MARASKTKSKPSTPPSRPIPQNLLETTKFQEEMFWNGFRRSVAFHAGLVIAALLFTLTLSRSTKKIAPSIRVDLVGLPEIKKGDVPRANRDDFEDLNSKLDKASKDAKKTLSDAKKAQPEAVPEKTPSEDSMVLKKEKVKPQSRKKDLQSALDRIKALAALENDDKKSKPSRKMHFAGNKLNSGNSISGETGQNADAFFGMLQDKVRNNWNLPVWLSKQNYSAAVMIFLDRHGNVTNAVIAKSSGSQQFDEYCLKTIRASQPFNQPLPPADILQEGITLGFPL